MHAGLQAHGFSVAWVTRAADADAALDSTAFDLVVLDLGLPDQDGLSLLARWRRLGRDEPVLVLTARDGVEHRVTGLNAGADDYLVKPFDLDELVARLHALMRRAAGRAPHARPYFLKFARWRSCERAHYCYYNTSIVIIAILTDILFILYSYNIML